MTKIVVHQKLVTAPALEAVCHPSYLNIWMSRWMEHLALAVLESVSCPQQFLSWGSALIGVARVVLPCLVVQSETHLKSLVAAVLGPVEAPTYVCPIRWCSSDPQIRTSRLGGSFLVCDNHILHWTGSNIRDKNTSDHVGSRTWQSLSAANVIPNIRRISILHYPFRPLI